jgi:hypothetical protein
MDFLQSGFESGRRQNFDKKKLKETVIQKGFEVVLVMT